MTWEEALRLLGEGGIVQAGQSHGLTVNLRAADGRTFRTRQPAIDAIFAEVQRLPEDVRSRIALLTE